MTERMFEVQERRCIRCGVMRRLSDFTPHRLGRDGLQASCKACERDRIQVWKHGMTREQKRAVAQAQGGCLTCGITEPGAKGWVVDHDRSCCPTDASCAACRRGVLCQWCNCALGYAKDNPTVLRRMADYLEAHALGMPGALPSASATGNPRTNGTDVRDGLTDGVAGQVDIVTVADAHAGVRRFDPEVTR